MDDVPRDHGADGCGPLSDAELWRCVEHTLRQVILPALAEHEEWARASTVQLLGLVRYVQRRPRSPSGRASELAAVLDELTANELVAEHAGGSVEERVAAVLAAAARRDDAAATQVRRRLRPVVIAELDDELAVSGALVDAFRGRLDEP